jgi:NADH:ubiquinone oxidoreductase subunit 4 (subunit M)
MAFPLLSVIVFLPLLGAMVLAGVPREHVNALRWGALVAMRPSVAWDATKRAQRLDQ